MKKNKITQRLQLSYIAILFLLYSTGCKKYLEIDAPATSLNAGNVYKDNATATAVLTSIYTRLANNNLAGNISVSDELSGDNLTLYSTSHTLIRYYQNNLLANPGSDHWSNLYPLIYTCNAAIEGLNSSPSIKAEAKKQLLGEAYFMRAFCYFYLVNEFGDVPLVTTTVFNTNIQLGRTPSSDVYNQMVKDLEQARGLLNDQYVQSDGFTPYPIALEERIRPNRSAATALLARVQLYLKNYAAAESMATEVINQSSVYTFNIPLEQVFLKNSKETIWALQPVLKNINTYEGQFMGNSNLGVGVYASEQLITSFQAGDNRKKKWTSLVNISGTSYPFPSKYKVPSGALPVTEYTIVLRLAEQCLIRAEARILTGNVTGGIDDLNVLRARAIDTSLPVDDRLKLLPSSLGKDESLIAVAHERRVELFAEFGHRWFDLKRTDKVDEVMTAAAPLKGGIWSAFKVLFPIPQTEINSSPLLKQNLGYN
jgi:hypothetical protein